MRQFESTALPFVRKFPRISTPGNPAFQRAMREFDQLFYQLIDERRESGTSNDLLSILIDARDESSNDGMSTQKIRDE